MKLRHALLYSAFLLLIGYIIGASLPPWFINLTNVDDAPMSSGDYYLIVVGAFTALGTMSAALVALFLSEIRSWFKKVSYNIRLDKETVNEDLIDVKGTKKAKRYFNSIIFENNGNINALNCELYLENATFKSNDVAVPLNWENAPIKWSAEHTMSYIPYQGKRVLPIFEITAPEKQSTPDGKINEIPSQINIAGLKSIESRCGCWEIVYCLYSSTSKPQKFKLLIEWNGKWEGRQTEMKDMLKLTLTMI